MSVLKLVEQQGIARPHATAVSAGKRRLSYAQLAARSDAIAAALRAAGVRRESIVAVYLERSVELVASLLAVWKADGAYLPIDPAAPAQRLAFTLQDAGVQFILTERGLLPSLPRPLSPDARSPKIVCIEDISPSAGDASFTPAEPAPGQLAYVLYTSGSTGKPKGAEVTHGGLANTLTALAKDFALTPSDVVLATATIAFDISNLEIYLPLMAGASVHVLERRFAGDPVKLMEIIRSTGATLVFGTPASWRMMLDAGWRGNPKLQIVTGGETLPLALGQTLAGITKALWNHYGPTETSICASRERILPNAARITIGRALDNVVLHVLDPARNPVPAGQSGELYIAGAGVGRGYLNRPDLTARAFLPDPFSSRPGARMYKTGDLVRVLPDGRLDFLGRADNQIKLRGHRIELEEIEAVIREYPGIHASVVQLIDNVPGDQRLVAYNLSDAPVPPAELREFLRQRLPAYMVPAELIAIETLPMTLNGKVDREALASIRAQRLQSVEGAFASNAPSPQPADNFSDNLEERLAAIWKSLLKVPAVAPDDNFFELGGHSLLAARLFSEIRKKFHAGIPLSILVQNPTVRELAAYIRHHPANGWPTLVPIQERGAFPPLFISHGLGGSLLLFRSLVEDLGPDQPIYGIQLAAPEHATPAELTIPALAARYVDEILEIDPVGPYALAGHSLGGLMVFEIATQLRRRGKRIGLLALLDCNFHLAQRRENLPPPPNVTLAERLRHQWSRLARFFQGNMLDMLWLKLIYNKFLFKIWALRLLHREGAYNPRLFGVDSYIALLAEQYAPQPLNQDAVLYVAKDQPPPTGDPTLGWAQVIGGRLDIEKIQGTHQTMFTHPNVATLASELAERLNLMEGSAYSANAAVVDAVTPPTKGQSGKPQLDPLLEYHGG